MFSFSKSYAFFTCVKKMLLFGNESELFFRLHKLKKMLFFGNESELFFVLIWK